MRNLEKKITECWDQLHFLKKKITEYQKKITEYWEFLKEKGT